MPLTNFEPTDSEFDDVMLDAGDITPEEIMQDDPDKETPRSLGDYDGKPALQVKMPDPDDEFRGGSRFYMDIETIPDYARCKHLIPDPVEAANPPDEVEAVAELKVDQLERLIKEFPCWTSAFHEGVVAAETAKKNRTGIHALLKKVQVGGGGGIDDALRKKLSCSPEYCRIVALSYAVGDGDIRSMYAIDENMERNLLLEFWQQVYTVHPIVTYNGLGFDLPVIMFRSAYLRVPASRFINLSPWKGDVVDVMKARYGNNPALRMKELGRMLNVEILAGDCDGSQVEELYKTNPDKLIAYNQSDVHCLRQIEYVLRGTFFR